MKKVLCFLFTFVFLSGCVHFQPKKVSDIDNLRKTANEFVRLITTEGLEAVKSFFSKEVRKKSEDYLKDQARVKNTNSYYKRVIYKIDRVEIIKDKGHAYLDSEMPKIDMGILKDSDTEKTGNIIADAPMENLYFLSVWVNEKGFWRIEEIKEAKKQ